LFYEVLGEYRHPNILYQQKQGDTQVTLCRDINKANRTKMTRISFFGMTKCGTQLTIDAKHWNRINLKERPVSVQLDLTYGVEWQLNAPKENSGVGEGH